MHLFVPNAENRTFYWGARILIVFNIMFYGAGIIGEALECIPLYSIWEPWIKGTCIDTKALNLTAAYFNLVVDIFIFVLPQRVIWNLHMAKSRKLDVSIIFSFGILFVAPLTTLRFRIMITKGLNRSIVCATGRIYATHGFLYVTEGDTNYSLANLYLWAFPEVSCVLLVHSTYSLPFLISSAWARTLPE